MSKLLWVSAWLLSACSLTADLDGLTAGNSADASAEANGPSLVSSHPRPSMPTASVPPDDDGMQEPDVDTPEPEPAPEPATETGPGTSPEPDADDDDPAEPEPRGPGVEDFDASAPAQPGGEGGAPAVPVSAPTDGGAPASVPTGDPAGSGGTPVVVEMDAGALPEPVDSGTETGGCPGATGCALLSVPLAADGDRTLYMIELPELVDLSAATLTYRVYVDAGIGGRVIAFAQHGGEPDYNLIQGGQRFFDQLSPGWNDVTWNIAGVATTFDKTVIKRLGLEVSTSGGDAWSNPTVLYLDSIVTSSNIAGPFPFDDAASIGSTSGSDVLSLSEESFEVVPGSTLTWVP